MAGGVGSRLLPLTENNPKPLLKTIDNLGASIKSTVFVGDTNTDYMTSKSARVPFILLLYGHGVIHQSFDTSCTPYLAKTASEITDITIKILKKY